MLPNQHNDDIERTMREFGIPFWLDWQRPSHPVFESEATADVAIIDVGSIAQLREIGEGIKII